MQLALSASKIIATKGSKIVELDVARSKPSAEALAELLIGPSGNLRAPTARIGKIWLVGFDAAMYASALE